MLKITSFFAAVVAFFSALFSGNLYYYLNVNIMKDVSYGTHERNCLDLYIPKAASGETGVVLVIHGGSFVAGDKSYLEQELRNWSKRGYVAASLNYRFVSNEISVFDELDDIEAALGKIKAVCAESNIQTNKVLLAGESAGAHLCLLYAYSRGETSPIKPAAILDRCGSVDLSTDEMMFGISGQEEAWRLETFSKLCKTEVTNANAHDSKVQEALKSASAITYISQNKVPVVICHARADVMVPFSQAQLLDQKLTENNIEHEFVIFENSNHGLSGDKAARTLSEELIIQYAEKYVG